MTAQGFVIVTTALTILLSGSIRGQPAAPVRTYAVAAGAASLSGWNLQVADMLRDGRLDVGITQRDTMIPGRVHERLPQRYEGLPVFGGQLIRQTDGRRTVSVFGRLFADVTVPTIQPTLDPRAAAAHAEGATGPESIALDAVLGILGSDDGYVLAYRLTVRSPLDAETVFVNAHSGQVERRTTDFRLAESPTVGTGTGVLNDRKKMSVRQTSSGFEARDMLRPSSWFTLDLHGSVDRLTSIVQSGTVFDADIAISPTRAWTDGAVVDAHVYQGRVYDYYARRFGRHGLDDHDRQVVSIVHPVDRADASLYSPEIVAVWINGAVYIDPGFVVYGDGDGLSFDPLAGGLDVVAHELTHGVTNYTSALEYRDEPGALNEAFSDIMATAMEFFFLKAGQGPQKGPNYLIGEDISRGGNGFRSLANPAAGYADHYSNRSFIGTATDYGGVHLNSTIASHAFYLAVEGGRNQTSGIAVAGIGRANMERMERIFYRAFVFMLTPWAQFVDARAATLQAASDLYGPNGPERAQLALAWDATGVRQ